jgi:hypothetical protein
MSKRNRKFSLVLTNQEKRIAEELAGQEGESLATVVRRLLRAEARRHGMWPMATDSEGVQPSTEGRKTR